MTGTNIVWTAQKFLPCPSPLIYQGVLYLVEDGGILTALDPKTAKVLKQGTVCAARWIPTTHRRLRRAAK